MFPSFLESSKVTPAALLDAGRVATPAVHRTDIDGLRGLAVAGVVAFHAGLAGAESGQLGVDVFFALSGYLITRLLLAEHTATGRIGLLAFYERRVRRIAPALLAVMLASLVPAFWLMLPDDLENFGQSLVATTLLANNVLLWKTSGYFEQATEFKPLMHTWSLAIEEQFYLLYPLVLAGVLQRFRRALWPMLAVLATASLVWAVLLQRQDPSAAFLLLPSKLWELVAGALVAVAIYPSFRAGGWFAEAGSAGGLLLILAAMAGGLPQTVLPAAVPAVAGTCLVLACGGGTWAARRLLSSRLPVALGLISYSLYLWHQPLLAFVRLASLEAPSVALRVGVIGLSLALAVVSWRFVETPFRTPGRVAARTLWRGFAGVSLALAALGLGLHATSGFVNLHPRLNEGMASAGRQLNAAYNRAPYQFQDQPFVEDGRTRVLVVGTSLARDFINMGLENGVFPRAQVVYQTSVPSCVARDGISEAMLRQIDQAQWLIFGSPSVDADCWPADLAYFQRRSLAHIVVIGDRNFGWNMNAVMLMGEAERRRYRARIQADRWQANQALATRIGPAHFVDVMQMLSDGTGLVPVVTPEGMLVSQDTMHLTRAGARFVGRSVFQHPALRDLR